MKERKKLLGCELRCHIFFITNSNHSWSTLSLKNKVWLINLQYVHRSFTLICCSVGKRVVHPIHSFQPIKVKLASVVSKAIIAISAQLVKTVITSGKDLNERAKVDVCGSLKYKTRTSTNINDTRKVLEKVQRTVEKQYCLSWWEK